MKKLILISALLIGSIATLMADVIITNGCQVVMNNSQLVVNGNWNSPGSGFTQNSGQVIFSGSESTNSSVLHNGFFKDVAVNKTGSGALSLNSNLNVNGTFTMQNGKVLTNANILNLGTTGVIVGEATGRYVVGKLSSTRIIGTSSSSFGGIGVSINSGTTDLGTVTLLRTTGAEATVDIDGQKSIARAWQFSGAISDEARYTTFNWLPDDQVTGGTGYLLWHSKANNSWYAPSSSVTTVPQTYALAVEAKGSYTAASNSPINLPSTIVFDEDNSKTINLATGLKGTGKYFGYLDDCTIYFNDGKNLKEIQKGKSSRAYTLSNSGNNNIAVSFSGMNATLTPVANWYGTESITFTLTESSKKVSLSKAVKSLEAVKAQESFFDITTVTVNAVNDAPVINSFFPAGASFATTNKNVKFSVKVSDVDNPFSGLNFKWFVKKGSDTEVQQTSTDSVFTSNFTEAAIYTVKAQASDGLLNTSTSWIVDANPSSIGTDLLPTVTEIQQNYPNPFNPATTIKYSIKDAVPVSINVYNYSGQLVKTLVNGTQNPGYYSVNWNADNVASGLYFYQMKAGDYQMIKRAMVIK